MKNIKSIALAALATVSAPLSSHAALILQTLKVLPDYYAPDVFQMNENDVVVGTLGGSFGSIGARWRGTNVESIVSVGPAHSAWAYGINNAGMAVGSLDKDGGPVHPMFNLPVLGSGILPHTGPSGIHVELRVVNDGGYAVGTYGSSAFYTHPIGYKATLPVAKVGTNFTPVAINNDADVLGRGSLGNIVYNLLDGTAVNVGLRVSTALSATALNELGDVAGVKTGNSAYIMPKSAAAPVITLGFGKVKAVHGMNDARELLVTTADNRPAILSPSDSHPDGVFTYLDTVITAPWTVTKLADINNLGSVCGVMRRPSTPEDGTSHAWVYRPFRIIDFTFLFPIFP